MPSSRSLSAFSLSLLLGCSSVVSGSGDMTPSPDGAVGADAPIGPDGGSCAPPSPLAPASACASWPELALASRADPSSPDTYSVEVVAGGDAVQPSCAEAVWPRGDDARVRFTAPRGGRWRFTASGPQLFALVVQRGCGAETACQPMLPWRGEHLSASLRKDLQMERGASVGLALDGCPAGTRCRYTVRAQRVGDLSCDLAERESSPCPDPAQQCALDPCDPERLRCVARDPHPLRSLRLPRNAAGVARAVGTLAPTARDQSWVLWLRWYDAAGAPIANRDDQLYVSPTSDGRFVEGLRSPPPGAVSARVWEYRGDTDEPAWALRANLEPYDPPGAGSPCGDPALGDPCSAGNRCDGASGLCRRVEALAITSLRVVRDPEGASVLVTLEGERLAESLWQAELTLLDEVGTPLGRVLVSAPALEPVGRFGFQGRLGANGQYTEHLPAPRLRRVRAVVRDAARRESAIREIEVETVAPGALGARCDGPSLSCAEGLHCERDEGRPAWCMPGPPCRLPEGSLVWSPPSSGSFTLQGRAFGSGASTSCGASRSGSTASGVFVAPRDGLYRFTLRDMEALELDPSLCDFTEEPQCVLAPGTTELSRSLRAGQRVGLVMSDRTHATARPTPFTLSVEVP